MDIDFWVRCLHAKCVVVPVQMYERFDPKGHFNETFRRGPRFIAISIDGEERVAGPDYYFQIEAHSTSESALHLTPEDALKAFEDAKAAV